MVNLESMQARWADGCSHRGDCPVCNPGPEQPEEARYCKGCEEWSDGKECSFCGDEIPETNEDEGER